MSLKCPQCGSERIDTDYLQNLKIDEYYCKSCGFEAHPISFENKKE